LADLEPGAILIDPAPPSTVISFDPPGSQVESAGEGAATAVRKMLDTPALGHPQLEAIVGALEVPLVPFAASYGAVHAKWHRLSPVQWTETEDRVARSLESNAVPEILCDRVIALAREKTSRRLLSSTSAPPASVIAPGLPVSAVLQVSVEQFKLERAKDRSDEHVLSIDARVRLTRSANSAVLFERSYHYQSGSSLFVDWSRTGGVEGVANTGYRSLAEQIVADIFQPLSEPPLLIGPGQKHSLRRSRPGSHLPGAERAHRKTILIRCQATPAPPRTKRVLGENNGDPKGSTAQDAQGSPTNYPAAVPTDSAPENLPAIQFHRGKVDERLRGPASGTGPESRTDEETHAEWMLDGLENDRNAVVQAASCLAAVPMGIWEQTVGAAFKPGREKRERLIRALDSLPEQNHFERALGAALAQRLQSQPLDPVPSPDEPAGVTLVIPSEQASRAPGYTNSPLALRIRVSDARLIGKGQNSRSLALCVDVQASVFRTSDGQELYSRPIVYRSSSKTLKDWAAADGRLFRLELETCLEQTTRAANDELVAKGFVKPKEHARPNGSSRNRD